MIVPIVQKLLGRNSRSHRESRHQLDNSDYSAFTANPAQFLYGSHVSEYVWPQSPVEGSSYEFFFDSMYFIVAGRQVGYVQQLAIARPDQNNAGRRAIVGHIATEYGHLRRGVGSALVRFLRAELHRRYDVRWIDFDENSRNWDAYPAFFAALGAVPMTVPHATRPRYRLQCSPP